MAIGFGEMEDALAQALSALHIERGGPFKTLQTSLTYSVDDALEASVSRPAPSCLVVMTDAQHSPLRPGNHWDSACSPVLVVAARSFRGRQAAARGDTDRAGVYDLLDVTRQALLGRVLFGPQSGELQIRRERLLVSSPDLVVWAQEWTVTIYH
ncbi:MAG: DUF1834 family protein [Magnetococcales bacterium]|nr:DUF1834 family protein [Magnetococcales bacterium]